MQDEYDMYAGLHKSPIFISVLAITIFLQVIIMQFLGLFFKVVPQLWQEWLVSIVIGFGSSIVSWIQRYITRNYHTIFSTSLVDLRRGGRDTKASGRSTSGRNSLQRVGSILIGDSSRTGSGSIRSVKAAPGISGKWETGRV